MSVKNHPVCMHGFVSKDELLDAIDLLNSKFLQCQRAGVDPVELQIAINEYHLSHADYPFIIVPGMEEYSNIVHCRKCGNLFDSYNHDSGIGTRFCYDPYVICSSCNDEFWHKWYSLPACKKVCGKWVRSKAHDVLIKEYFKQRHFGMD